MNMKHIEQHDKYEKFQDKWIRAFLVNGELDSEYYVFVNLLNDRNNKYSNCGHLFIKYEREKNWKITDFEINSTLRGMNYGSAMLLAAVNYIHQLSLNYPNETQASKFYGEIGGIYLGDYKDGNIELSNDYWKLKDFYERNGFIFEDKRVFSRKLEQRSYLDWIDIISSNMRIRQLKIETAVLNAALKTYESDMQFIKKSWIGKFLLKRRGS